MLKYFKILFFYLLLLFSFKTESFAVDYFYDSFDIRDNSKWTYNCQHFNSIACSDTSSNISYEDGSLTLSTDSAYFPVVFTKDEVFPESSNFVVKIRFRYPSVTNRGVGLGIGFTGPYNKLFSQFGIWNDSSSGQDFKFYYNDFDDNDSQGYCSNFTLSTDDNLGRQTIANIPLRSDLYWHVLEIRKISDVYTVFIDRDERDIPIFTTSIKNNCIPNIIWFGNFIPDGGGSWTTFSLDEVSVSDSFSIVTPIPTSTPTPVPVERSKKIFILPGLGASWNSDAIVYGKKTNDSDWKMTPFVNNYDGLVELLKNNGLEENRDFFVWNYDWRKPVSEIKNGFNDFVDSKNLTESDDIYLVGHSLGGVVARLWIQDHSSDQRIKNVINLGSPNLGSLDSYSVWNGGKVLEVKGISSVAFQILLGLQNKSFVLTDVNKIRSFAPVVKDLLPNFDFVSKNGKVVSWKNLEVKNNFLENQNQSVSNISSRLSLAVGVGKSTPSILKLGNRSVLDKTLGLWPDGKLLNFLVSNGDGTVLKSSAGFGSENKTEVNSDHGEIINKSIDLIAEKLGLENKSISFNYIDNFSDSLVIFVGSPASSSLKCGGDIFEEKDGFIVAKNKNYRDCELTLSPTDNGIVHLVLGNTKSNEWNYLEKEVALNTQEKIKVSFSGAEILTDKDNGGFLMNSIRNDLEKLKLTKAIKAFDKGELTKVVLYVFEYRSRNNERVITQRILDNLFYLAAIVGPDKNKENYKTLGYYVDLIENTVELKSKRKVISKESAFSLVQLENLEIIVKSLVNKKIYPSYSMVLVLSSGYGAEAIRN